MNGGPPGESKVFLFHGDTTPAPILGPLAHALVGKNHRVMLVSESYVRTISQIYLPLIFTYCLLAITCGFIDSAELLDTRALGSWLKNLEAWKASVD